MISKPWRFSRACVASMALGTSHWPSQTAPLRLIRQATMWMWSWSVSWWRIAIQAVSSGKPISCMKSRAMASHFSRGKGSPFGRASDVCHKCFLMSGRNARTAVSSRVSSAALVPASVPPTISGRFKPVAFRPSSIKYRIRPAAPRPLPTRAFIRRPPRSLPRRRAAPGHAPPAARAGGSAPARAARPQGLAACPGHGPARWPQRTD